MPSRFLTIPEAVTDFRPDYSASGSMTFTTVSTPLSEYLHLGDLVIFNFKASGTTGGTASNELYMTIPITFRDALLENDLPVFQCFVTDVGAKVAGIACKRTNYANQLCIQRYDAGNFGLGTVSFVVSGHYFSDNQGTLRRTQFQEDVRQLAIEVEQLKRKVDSLG